MANRVWLEVPQGEPFHENNEEDTWEQEEQDRLREDNNSRED